MSTDTYLGSGLSKFLSERRVVDKKHEISMTGMDSIKGKWHISDADYPEFLNHMHTYLFENDLRPNGFIEQRRADRLTPLLVDLDFKYPSEKSLEHAFSDEQIQSFVHEIYLVLKEFFVLNDRSKLRFFVTLRPQGYVDPKSPTKEIKDGIHIVCPDFSVGPDLHGFIRHMLVEKKAVTRSFVNNGYKAEQTDASIYDKTLVDTNGWFFYGESKASQAAYSLKHILSYNTTSGKLSHETITKYDSKQLMELLSIRYKLQPILTVQEDQKDYVDSVIQSMHVRPVATLVDKTVVAGAAGAAGAVSINHEQGMLPMILESYNSIVSSDDEIAIAKELTLHCLSSKRAEEYDSWIKVGWCLRNIDDSNEMFETWMEFSKKSDKSSGNNIEQLRRDWLHGTMRRVDGSPCLKIGSLRLWAREDNYVKHNEIMDRDIISFITKTAFVFQGGTHHHVAKMVHKLFYDVYKCTVDGRNTEWYEFRDHIWNSMPQGLLIKTTITDTIAYKVDSARHSLKHPESNDPDYENKKETYDKNMKKMLKLQENLYNANFKDSVVKEAVQLFYDRDFYKKINQNIYLLGCANGILNLRDMVFDDAGNPVRYKPTLRPGSCHDYVTLKTGVTADGKDPIDYVPYDANDPKQKEIQDFFKKIFPSDELREYVLTLAAGCLEGANKEQCFYIMTGSGGNGKSKFVDLMTGTLGQYGGSLASTALTRKRPESGAANPDIMSIKGCRFVEIKEPDDGEPINSARMKQFSGEDLVEARGLFKDQEKFKITGKIFLACNRMPPIHSMDGGTWRRIRVIPFDSKFVAKGDPIDESQHIYPRDDMMDEKLKSWRVPFFSLLVHYYETRYCPNGIQHVPKIVMQACEDYKGDHDSIGKFLKARIDRQYCTIEDTVTIKQLMKVYKSWLSEQTSTGKKVSENEIKPYLKDKGWGEPINGAYKSVLLFDTDEEKEEHIKTAKEARGFT